MNASLTEFKYWCDTQKPKIPYSDGQALQRFFSIERGKELKIRLIEDNLSQQEFANKIGVSLQALNGVLNGQSRSLNITEEIEKYLNSLPKPLERIIDDVKKYIDKFGKVPNYISVSPLQMEAYKRYKTNTKRIYFEHKGKTYMLPTCNEI